MSSEVDAGEVTDFTPGEDDSTARVTLSGGTLTIQGSRVGDAFQVRYRDSVDTIAVRSMAPFGLHPLALQLVFALSDVQRIRVFGMAGDDDIDLIELPESITVTFYGGGGADVQAAQNISGTLRFYGEAGDDIAEIYPGEAKFGRRILDGGSGNDSLSGGTRNDLLFGDAGNDTPLGRGGNDQLQGGSGADQLFGDRGNDTLFGGDGIDAITSGSGSDSFAEPEGLAGEVLDFDSAIDR